MTTLFVPGRIEVLGKHTDYAGGSSLLVAVDRGFTFTAEPAAGPAGAAGAAIVIRSEDSGDAARWSVRRPETPPAPGWARYVDGVVQRVAADFGDALRGARIGFSSTLPIAAGLSSSSALVTGAFLALDAVCGISETAAFRDAVPDRAALASWLSAAEMGGPVGTRGGSQDHTAILLAEAGRVVRYGLAPVRARGSAPVPEGWMFAVGSTGVVADKGGAVQAHYNRLSDLARDAARAWAASQGETYDVGAFALNLGTARDSGAPADAILDAVRRGAPALGLDPDPLVRRARHFLEEQALVDAAFDGLEAGDVPAFADAANRSAQLGAELLENQVPETLVLADLARELDAPAASPFGAGFGGSVWALVPEADADAFLVAWEGRYLDRFPDRSGAAEFFVTPAGPPATSPSDRNR